MIDEKPDMGQWCKDSLPTPKITHGVSIELLKDLMEGAKTQ